MELVTGVRSSVYTTPAPGNSEKAESETGLRLLSFLAPNVGPERGLVRVALTCSVRGALFQQSKQ